MRCPHCKTSLQSAHEPKVKGSALIEVDGWVMLNKVDEGKYRIKNLGDGTYGFYKPNSKKQIIRHYCKDVDSWIRDHSKDLNRIRVVKELD